MSTRVFIDKAGRVAIPKRVRDEFHLRAGDVVELESNGERITLRPERATGRLAKEHGVWVFYSGRSLPASISDAVLRNIRRKRDLASMKGVDG